MIHCKMQNQSKSHSMKSKQIALKLCKLIINKNLQLAQPDFTKKFFYRTDASFSIISGVLLQKCNLSFQPIFYVSRKLNSAEINYTVMEKECLAIVWCIKKFKPYLYNEFEGQKDHKSLVTMQKLNDAKTRIRRWQLYHQS